ncbi:MAG TPA: trehalose-phosphatase [Rhizomicrobium sp.]|nr:trehalose-phosphatase [Rhizomicrobium sp.]
MNIPPTFVRNQPYTALPAPQVAEFSLAGDAFLLDIDGTLLDIAATPESVRVPAPLKATLAILQQSAGGALALVSGRPLSAIDQLFAPLSLAAIGCHGAEWRKRAGDNPEFRAAPLPSATRKQLLEAVSDIPGIFVEDKGYTLAFHYRRVPEQKAALRERLAAAIRSFHPQLCLLHGKAVFEVKPCAFDKGEAIAALMNAPPFSGRRPVFAGDDHTDEYALAVVHQMRGLGISVGRKLQDAERILPAPYAVRSLLAQLAQRSG